MYASSLQKANGPRGSRCVYQECARTPWPAYERFFQLQDCFACTHNGGLNLPARSPPSLVQPMKLCWNRSCTQREWHQANQRPPLDRPMPLQVQPSNRTGSVISCTARISYVEDLFTRTDNSPKPPQEFTGEQAKNAILYSFRDFYLVNLLSVASSSPCVCLN